MKKTLTLSGLALLLACAFSCKKGSIETNYNPSLIVANNQVIAERAYSQVFNIFFMVVNDSTLKADGSNEIYGAHCSYEASPVIRYMIDYLPWYSPCPDGKVRKGIITATLDKDFALPGASAVLTFSGYTVDGLLLEGNNIIVNDGLNEALQPVYSHLVPSGVVILVDSLSQSSFRWESEKTFTLVDGNASPENYDDDIFMISGSATGTAVNNAVFGASTTEALGNYLDCRWIRTGITLLSMPGLDVNSGSIHYTGTDSCHNLVTYYFNENPFFERFERH
jgi:hypothetical protein